MKCANCGTGLSCGCQQRQASDGRRCCSKCIGQYESVIKLRKTQTKVNAQLFNTTPRVPDLKGKYYSIEKEMIDTFYAMYMYHQYGVEVGYKTIPWQESCMNFELASWQFNNDCGTLCELSNQ